MGGTRRSGIVSRAADVLWMSVVRVMRGVGGVCAKCVYGLGRRRKRGGERIGFELYQSCGNRWIVGRVSVFGLRWYVCGVGGECVVSVGSVWCRWGVGGAGGEWVVSVGSGYEAWNMVWKSGVVLRLCEL